MIQINIGPSQSGTFFGPPLLSLFSTEAKLSFSPWLAEIPNQQLWQLVLLQAWCNLQELVPWARGKVPGYSGTAIAAKVAIRSNMKSFLIQIKTFESLKKDKEGPVRCMTNISPLIECDSRTHPVSICWLRDWHTVLGWWNTSAVLSRVHYPARNL